MARMAESLQIAVELGEQQALHLEVLDHGLDDQVAVDQRAEVVGGGRPGRGPPSPRRPSSLPRSTCLFSDFSSEATMASAVSCFRRPEHHVVSGLRRDLGDP